MLLGARQFFERRGGGGLLPRGFTQFAYLRITANLDSRLIDTGITVPSAGDFVAVIDYIHQVSNTYTPYGGVRPRYSTSIYSTGFASFGYVFYRNVYYSVATNNSFDFKTPDRWSDISVRFGIIDDEQYVSVKNISSGATAQNSHQLVGGERGGSGDTFHWGITRLLTDNSVGTVQGAARLVAGDRVVWDGIPCVRDADSAVGYFDIVGRQFCQANSGWEATNEMPTN